MPYERDDSSWIRVTFGMDIDSTQVHHSSGFTVIDLVADIGGLAFILYHIARGLVSMGTCNNTIENSLISRLYKIKTTGGEQNSYAFFSESSWCHNSRERKARRKAKKSLDRESNIIDAIKLQRYFKKALKMLITDDK